MASASGDDAGGGEKAFPRQQVTSRWGIIVVGAVVSFGLAVAQGAGFDVT